MVVKGSRRDRRTSNCTDEVIRALRDEFIRGFRVETAAIARDFGRNHRVWVARLSGSLLASYLKEVYGREDYINEVMSARKEFGQCLKRWCDSFPRQLTTFSLGLCEMGYDIESIKRQLDEICLALRNVEARNWLLSVCGDDLDVSGWRAPLWLVHWPEIVYLAPSEIVQGDDGPDAVGERIQPCDFPTFLERVKAILIAADEDRLDDDQTRELCKRIQDDIGKPLAAAKEEALNRAIIFYAKRDSVPHRSQTARPRHLESIIQEAMKRHPDFCYRDICGRVDDRCETERRPIPVPRKCKQHNHKTLVESIDCVNCRDYMTSFLSTERKPLTLPRPPKSKFPEKSKVAKLHEVRN